MTARLLALLLVLLLTPSWCPAADFRELEGPVLRFMEGYPERAQEDVQAVLQADGCAFLGGVEFNGMTSLRYRGATAALNRFLAGLARCLEVTMRVSFSSDLDERTDWRVFHHPNSNSFHIEIAPGSKRIVLEKLMIPEIGKPPAGIY